MAYGAWTTAKWKQIWKNSYYKIEVEWQARKDNVANKVQYRVTRIRCTSLSSARSFWNTGTCGIATITGQRKTYSRSMNVKGGRSQTIDLTDDSREVSANSSGVVTSECNVHGYWKSGINANGTPEIGWTVAHITSELPSCDRRPPTTTVSVASKTQNSVTLNITTSDYSSKASYKQNSGADTQYTTPSSAQVSGGGTYQKTFTGLSPNTTYTFQIRHNRDLNALWGSYASVSVTTNKPAAPTKGTVSVLSKTYNSITYSISGFSFGAGGTWGKYQWSSNNSSWTDIGSNNHFTRSGLSPNTSYTTYVRLVDNYGSASASASVATTTNKPAVPSGGTVTVSDITYNSAKMTYSGFKAGAGASIARYDVVMRPEPGDEPWINNGLKTSYAETGLPPNTYCIARVTAVDNYSQRSAAVDAYFTTKKPAAGDGATITASVSVTTSTATITLSGGTAGAGGSRSYYRYYWDGAWHNLGSGTSSFTLSGLTAGTDYSVQVGFVDNYGTASSSKTVDFTTYQPGKPTAGTISVTQNAEGKYTVTASGFTAIEPAVIKQYVFTFGTRTIKTDTNTAIFFPVMPNTLYQVSCYVVDSFNQQSNTVNIPYETFGEIPEVNIMLGKMLIMTAESTGTITVDTVDNLIDDLVRS